MMTPGFLKVRPDYLKIPLIYTPGIRLEYFSTRQELFSICILAGLI